MKPTAIIIVNYKTPWHLNECLKSVFKYTDNFHIFLVQNEPDSQSLKVSAKFRKRYPNQITEYINEYNLGLVGGVNTVYKEAVLYERVCFLNSDIIVTKNWLLELNKALDSAPDVIQVAPDLNHYYKDKFIWRFFKNTVAKYFPRLGNYLYKLSINFNPPRTQDKTTGFLESKQFFQFCTGACNLVKSWPFIDRGFFWDPKIIHGYGDDFDTTFFLRQYGKVGVINSSYVFHFINSSFNMLTEEQKGAKNSLKQWNRYYVVNKWEKEITKELKNFSLDQLMYYAEMPGVINDFLVWSSLTAMTAELKEKIKMLPAKEYAKKLGIFVPN